MRDEYAFLSNFYNVPISIVLAGETYTFRNTEAAFQAQKNYSRAKEFELLTASEAKKLGKSVEITTEDWDHNRLFAMARVLHAKFKSEDLMAKLKNVTEEIVEDNYWNDTFWGVCTNRKYDHVGKNMLGKMLMNIRDNNNDLNCLLKLILDELIDNV